MLRTVVLLLILALLAAARPIVPGVLSRPVGACEVDYHAGRQVIALACAVRDMLRLWPLPPAYPWFEDRTLPEPLIY